MRNQKRGASQKQPVQLTIGYRDSLPRDPLKRALEMAQIAAAREQKNG